MKTDLDHLPAQKQRELDHAVRVIFEEFKAAHADAKSNRRRGKIVKIILYGSHARGGWVDEPHTAKGYVSDFDLLIIVSSKEIAERDTHWADADERFIEEQLAGRLRTPVNFIVHSLQEVNHALAHGRFFFMDIVRDGIVLFESDDRELRKPHPKSAQANLDMAREYFEEWMPSAEGRVRLGKYAIDQGLLKHAAFEFHQAVEGLYHCLLLVCTFYTPHNHNIAFLRTQAERLDLRLVDAWPRGLALQRYMFTKLRDAYVKARYSSHYQISVEELTWQAERIEELGRIVHTICTERLAALEVEARG